MIILNTYGKFFKFSTNLCLPTVCSVIFKNKKIPKTDEKFLFFWLLNYKNHIVFAFTEGHYFNIYFRRFLLVIFDSKCIIYAIMKVE